MRGNYYIIKGPFMATILWLVLLAQLQFMDTKVEAKYHVEGHRRDDSGRLSDNSYEDSNQNNFYFRNKGRRILHNLEKKQRNKNAEMGPEDNENKCNIVVPTDILHRYPDARRMSYENKGDDLVRIEICCKGYASQRWRNRIYCRPICENCQNGHCVAPDKCECYDEYVANDNGDCVFTCPIGCLNGQCYLDGSCQCDPGYKLDETRKFCRPICSKGCGVNALHNCTEPEVCGCVKGYILGDKECEPICQHNCGTGGTCIEPNKCMCKPGFNYNGLSQEFCHATCYQKCDNGVCYSPNRCICNPGFTYHERLTTCIPK